VKYRRVALHRRLNVGHGGQDFVVNVDEAHSLFGDVRAGGGNSGDGMAPVEGFIRRQNVVTLPQDRAFASLREVRGGHDGAHAIESFGLGSVDRLDSSVSVRAAKDAATQQPSRCEVCAV
jgi:hypothetical protein